MTAQPLLILDAADGVSLQDRIRKCVVDAAVAGVFGHGRRLPSSRSLARQLGVSRNTVVLAYARLVDEGFLVSQPRSGLYVNEDILRSRAPDEDLAVPAVQASEGPAWIQRLRARGRPRDDARPPPNWRQYPYPFVDGLFDPSLFPASEWRDANRLTLSRSQIQAWSTDAGDADDPHLVEEIRSKLLPRRGIRARPDEILVTLGVQHGFNLATQVLLEKDMTVGLEQPGYADLAELARETGAQVIHQPVDDAGIVVDERLDACDLVFVGPSHQYPTGATLSMQRRRALLDKACAEDMVLIEDDTDCETNYGEGSLPALRALDQNDRVIYVAGLAKVLTPGLRLGFMVGPSAFIAEARRRRRLGVRHPPLANQRAVALFLSLGHYDTTMLRLGRIFRERRNALRDALDFYLPLSLSFSPNRGGTAYWVRGNEGFDAAGLAAKAEQRGILLETAEPFFSNGPAPKHIFRMGVTGVPLERIRGGVEILAELIRDMSAPHAEPEWCFDSRLAGRGLRTALVGATILYRTNYGEPCSIHVHRDGTLTGRLGHAGEETDIGVWSVQGDLWHRQWSNWAYGERGAFHVAVRGERLAWFAANGKFLASSVISRQ